MHRVNVLVAGFGGLCLLSPGIVRSQPTNRVFPPPGLVSWWRAEGDARDAAGNNDGRVIDGVRFPQAKVGKGFAFSGGGDDYVLLPNDLFPMPQPGATNSPFSFEVWFSTLTGGGLLGQQDKAPFGQRLGGYVPALYVGTNGLLRAKMFFGDGPQLTSPTNVNDGQFHHAAVTYDGVVETLYVDGAAVASAPLTQRAYSATYQYEFGTAFTGGWTNAPGGWFPFVGIMDEPALYNRALTPEEVAAIYRAGSAGKCVGMARQQLRHRYSFDGPAKGRSAGDSATGADGAVLYSRMRSPYTNGLSDGSALVGNGSLTLSGARGYLSLPPYLISSLSSASFEAWLTWNGPASSYGESIFEFGANDSGPNASGSATNYLVLSPSTANTHTLGFASSMTQPTSFASDVGAAALYGPNALPMGQPTYLAVTYDPIDGLSQLYMDGELVSSIRKPLNTLDQFLDESVWLGRSQSQGAPAFEGQFDEFRIWEGTLTPAQVAEHYAAGPDEALPVPPAQINIQVTGRNVGVFWRGDLTTGYHLDYLPRAAATNWTAVSEGVTANKALRQYAVPFGRTEGYYRLEK